MTAGAPEELASRDLKVGAIFDVRFCPDAPALIAAAGSKGKVALWNGLELEPMQKRLPNARRRSTTTATCSAAPSPASAPSMSTPKATTTTAAAPAGGGGDDDDDDDSDDDEEEAPRAAPAGRGAGAGAPAAAAAARARVWAWARQMSVPEFRSHSQHTQAMARSLKCAAANGTRYERGARGPPGADGSAHVRRPVTFPCAERLLCEGGDRSDLLEDDL